MNQFSSPSSQSSNREHSDDRRDSIELASPALRAAHLLSALESTCPPQSPSFSNNTQNKNSLARDSWHAHSLLHTPFNLTNCSESACSFQHESPSAPPERIKLEPCHGASFPSPAPTFSARIAPDCATTPFSSLMGGLNGTDESVRAPSHLDAIDETRTYSCSSGSVASSSIMSSASAAAEHTNARESSCSSLSFEQRLHWFQVSTSTSAATASRASPDAAGAAVGADRAACCGNCGEDTLRSLRPECDPRSMQSANAAMSLSVRLLPADEAAFASRVLIDTRCGQLVSH